LDAVDARNAVQWKLLEIDLELIVARLTIDVEAVRALEATLDDFFALVASQADILRSKFPSPPRSASHSCSRPRPVES
jgi:hypothetical protein